MEIREGLTFDDVLLQPRASSILPGDADLTTRLTQSIVLNVPLLSAAMTRLPKPHSPLQWRNLAAWASCTVI